MVQILNKMVHLKYPILEIWCCHKHITQLPPSRLKFDTKLRKACVPKQSGTIALHKSFLQGKYCTQFVCLFQPIKCKHVILRFLATFGTCYSSQCFFKAQMWQKAEEYVPKQVCQHSTAQVIVTGKIRRVLHVNLSVLWPIKCMHSKPRF